MYLAGGKSDPWDMSGMTNELPKEQQKPKSPADFLGENANLVNLDNLVTRPASASKHTIQIHSVCVAFSLNVLIQSCATICQLVVLAVICSE